MKNHLYSFVFSIIAAVFVVAEVAFADCPIPTRMPVPTLSEWGMIGAALFLGLASTYSILKQKQ
jgi:hypothetical protein